MANSKLDSLETVIYAVYEDLVHKEFSTIDIAFKQRPIPLFVVMKENKGQSRYSNSFMAHSKYTFFDSESKETVINVGNWTILKVEELENTRREVHYYITDPAGKTNFLSNLKLRNSDWSYYFHIEGICRIVKLLRNISIKYPDWSYYDLATENNLLLTEVKELKRKVESLEKQIMELKAQF